MEEEKIESINTDDECQECKYGVKCPRHLISIEEDK